MHPSHIAANGVEQQSVTPLLSTHHPNSSIAHMPLVPAVLVFWLLVPPAFYFYFWLVVALSEKRQDGACD